MLCATEGIEMVKKLRNIMADEVGKTKRMSLCSREAESFTSTAVEQLSYWKS
jgi:hypothetical protein